MTCWMKSRSSHGRRTRPGRVHFSPSINAPAQKCLPSPRRTITRASASCSACTQACSSSHSREASYTFSGGRSSVITPTFVALVPDNSRSCIVSLHITPLTRIDRSEHPFPTLDARPRHADDTLEPSPLHPSRPANAVPQPPNACRRLVSHFSCTCCVHQRPATSPTPTPYKARSKRPTRNPHQRVVLVSPTQAMGATSNCSSSSCSHGTNVRRPVFVLHRCASVLSLRMPSTSFSSNYLLRAARPRALDGTGARPSSLGWPPTRDLRGRNSNDGAYSGVHGRVTPADSARLVCTHCVQADPSHQRPSGWRPDGSAYQPSGVPSGAGMSGTIPRRHRGQTAAIGKTAAPQNGHGLRRSNSTVGCANSMIAAPNHERNPTRNPSNGLPFPTPMSQAMKNPQR